MRIKQAISALVFLSQICIAGASDLTPWYNVPGTVNLTKGFTGFGAGVSTVSNGVSTYQDVAGVLATRRIYTLTCAVAAGVTYPLPDLGSVGIELLEVNGTNITAIPSDLVYAGPTNGVYQATLTAVPQAVVTGTAIRIRFSNDASTNSQVSITNITLMYAPAAAPMPTATAPQRYGSRPGTPFLLYLGAADAGSNRVWSARNLPAGLNLNSSNGIISGTTPAAGTNVVSWSVNGSGGTANGQLQFVSGNTLALTPPVGWNSWNGFEQNINETIIHGVADAIVHVGLMDYGFTYVNLDDEWALSARSGGNLVADPSKFPNGLNALSAYLHAAGLKFGIYSDAAETTCSGAQPGSYTYEINDANTFAAWGVDFLKYDYCNAPSDQATAISRYGMMGNALASASRSIVFNICEWGQRSPWIWAATNGGNLWRTTFDMRDNWQFTTNNTRSQAWIGCLDALDLASGLESCQHPGAWNDPDMPSIGVDLAGSSSAGGATGLNSEQEQSEYSLWALMSSPLIFNADLRKMDPQQTALYDPVWAENMDHILCNPEVLAVNQDIAGNQGVRVRTDGNINIYRKTLADGTLIIGLLNRVGTHGKITLTTKNLGMSGTFQLRDLWMRRELGSLGSSRTVYLKPYETRLLLVHPVMGPGKVLRRTAGFESAGEKLSPMHENIF